MSLRFFTPEYLTWVASAAKINGAVSIRYEAESIKGGKFL
jgi:hypothetical protein